MRAEVNPVPADGLPRHMGSAPLALGRAKWRGMARGCALYGLVVALVGWHVARDREMARLADALERATDKVVYHQTRDDGTIMAAASFKELPLAFQRDNVHNALWEYVFNQDCYAASRAVRANYRVQKMSSPAVRQQWTDHMKPQNPDSPQVRLGRKGHYYECRELGMEFRPGGQDTYGFRFERVEIDTLGKPVGQKETMYASAVYRTGVHDDDDKDGNRDKAVFNAPGIQVIQYVRARPEGTSSQRVVSERR